MPSARIVSFGKISKTEGDVLLNALRRDGRDNIEVVFPPSLSGEHEYFGNISDERVLEFKFTSSSEVYEKYKACGFEFVSFEGL